MHISLAHDYLTQRGGAERVALAMTRAFPGAPMYASVYAPEATFPDFQDVDVRTSFLQHVPVLRQDPRYALPLLVPAWNHLEIEPTDAVVVSSSGWAHGVKAPMGAVKVVYCHNPARWLYQSEEYVSGSVCRSALQLVKDPLVRWDKRAAGTADVYLANSRQVADRILRTYGIEADVVHPPVSVDVDGPQEPVEGLEPGFWLTVARGRGYKNVGAVIDGVGLLGDGQLAVVGSPAEGQGDEDHTAWLGVVSDAQLRWLYANARALISVSYEDFGLTPLEANAFGTPVAVLRAGGFLESLDEGVSGVFVEAPSGDAVRDALASFPVFDATAVRAHAARFDEARFAARLRSAVSSLTHVSAA